MPVKRKNDSTSDFLEGSEEKMIGDRSEISWIKRLERWYTDHEWVIIVLLAIIAEILGYVGYQKYLLTSYLESPFNILYTDVSPLNILYLDIKLFTQNDTITGYVPIELNLARFLVPGAFAYAGIKAALTIFHNQFTSFRVRFWKNHTVICGLGDKGMQLMKDFCYNGKKVIVIESDANNDKIAESRDKGAHILIGNAPDKYLLKKARVQHAKYLLLVSGDDGVNVETAIRFNDIVAQKNRKKQTPNEASSGKANTEKTQCCIHITDFKLRELFTQNKIFTDTNELYEIKLFNVYENSARTLFKYHSPDRYIDTTQEGTRVHILVVGFGQMGQSVVLQAAKTCHYANGEKLQVTVVDNMADKKKANFYYQYPQIGKVCDINFENMDVNDPEFLEGKLFDTTAKSTPINFIVIAFKDSQLCLTCALSILNILKKLGERKVPIMIRMKDETGLATLLEKGSDLTKEHIIYPFGTINQSSTREVVVNEVLDKLAKAVHEDYVKNQIKEGQSVQTDPNMLPWLKLNDDFKDSNRQAADHIPVKLRAVGCRGVPSKKGQKQKPFKFTKDEVELLSKMEHSRWTAERLLKGWTYDKKKDADLKKSPYLVEWEKLTDTVKKYDRDMVNNIPNLLAMINQEIQRNS